MPSLFIFICSFLFYGAAMAQELFKYDFNDFKVATHEYKKGPTGLTLFYFPKGAYAALDIRGGAAAVRESSSIDELNTWGYVDAIVLAGGSTYGLEAASGVMAELLKKRDNKTHFDYIPAVPAAIVYDFAGRTNALYPDKKLGSEAFHLVKENEVAVKKAGAGINVTVGKYFGRDFSEESGQGAAFYTDGKVKIFVLTVLNAVGAIHDFQGKVIAGNRDSKTGERNSINESLLKNQKSTAPQTKESTTISIVITNVKMDRIELKRLAVMAHTAMGRTIIPFHTPWDGDTLFAASTGSLEKPKDLEVTNLGVIAGELLNQAVINCVTKK